VIRDNAKYQAYYWKQYDNIQAVVSSNKWKIVYTGDESDHVYLRVKAWSPFQSLVPK